ncbi:phosphohydrolase [gut metagenome]|uniref:Phosphohydrolase n=1 Tax=gut metagenome TaxID=749906 RepID=J9GLM7_9ZZZZ
MYYALGNHEYKLLFSEYRQLYEAYEKRLTQAGVCFLHNEKDRKKIRTATCYFHGLELPWEYYKKPRSKKLTKKALEELLGVPEEEGLHILLAHNPKYGKPIFLGS